MKGEAASRCGSCAVVGLGAKQSSLWCFWPSWSMGAPGKDLCRDRMRKWAAILVLDTKWGLLGGGRAPQDVIAEEGRRTTHGSGSSSPALFPPPQLAHIRPGNEAEICCESLRPFPSLPPFPPRHLLPPRCHRAAVRPQGLGLSCSDPLSLIPPGWPR